MYEITTPEGIEADYEEMRSFVERCKKMMDNLIDSREEAYQALQKMKDLGFDDPVADDFEQQFVEVSKKIDELHELLEKTGEYYEVLAEKVEIHLNSYYKD
jgi:hypothetical protein